MVNANNTKSTSPNDMHEANNVGGGVPKRQQYHFLIKSPQQKCRQMGGGLHQCPL